MEENLEPDLRNFFMVNKTTMRIDNAIVIDMSFPHGIDFDALGYLLIESRPNVVIGMYYDQATDSFYHKPDPEEPEE